MAVPTTSGIEETLDAVLQQQLISPTFRVYDRIKRQSLSVPGTKAVYKAIKETILAGFRATKKGDLEGFVEFCQGRFNLAKQVFDEKLAALPKNDDTIDERLKFMIIASALRDHWQDMAYETVLAEIATSLRGRGYEITRDHLNSILSQDFGPGFSLMVNLFVIRLWSQLTCTPLKIRASRLKILNMLTASVIKKLDG
ncbi:MAG TPA: hypothetical protein VKM55_22790 [Candidatus Lokiarchaeia archaeon]|nr:hypothetical protein [Candidatus Lokiarchaeia archaeon]